GPYHLETWSNRSNGAGARGEGRGARAETSGAKGEGDGTAIWAVSLTPRPSPLAPTSRFRPRGSAGSSSSGITGTPLRVPGPLRTTPAGARAGSFRAALAAGYC